MNKKRQQNSGFSLIELIIALAVLAFLMLAVSSFMGASVSHTKKEQADVKIQTQAQETYSLITDSIMQSNEILMVGYTTSNPDDVSFKKPGETSTATFTKKFYVKDKAVADALLADPSKYGVEGSVSKTDIVYFKDLDSKTPVYVSYLRIESSVPLDMNFVPGGNPNIIADQVITNDLTGEATKVSCTEQNSKKVYSVNDTLVSSFYFKDNNLYYGRKYAFMTSSDDEVDMTDDASMQTHLYSKYFSYLVGKASAVDVGISGCVATVNAADGSIGIDLYYKQSDMEYTTNGRVNPRNSYVLVPKK